MYIKMSAALVRQALELVDQEEGLGKKKSRRPASQERRSFKNKIKKSKEPNKSKEQITEENIKKLLALSKATADPAIAEKIVERAIKQKPLADKPQVKREDNKSILFSEVESFRDFENELFCS